MRPDLPQIAAMRATAGVPVDAILAETAAILRPAVSRIAGIVQEEHGSGERPMTRLRDLRDGALVRISQDLGRHARGCRLDPGALAQAARRLEDALDAGADLLILNRFGKSEAEGGGLRPVIERVMLAGIPILTAVRDAYAGAWEDFHGGLAVRLPAERQAVLGWCHAALHLNLEPM
ncbi:DUF2478 domain-containing protein [Chelativorans intermedius]|uniref:DUF2478 domain-containing protein n=1 Tax=Chelativorans intermedius TaxID=515947 RepID=A0ABV6DCZ4_9HYPH|nr:DUF2478 domain-containing protein [Chelativorans intermedius]MCT9000514.1 DUF2478 domain-containing protein [Chelativorans intermedius]